MTTDTHGPIGHRVAIASGMAYVEVPDDSPGSGGWRSAGIWLRGPDGLADNKFGGSADWTRKLADQALREVGL